MEVRRLQTSDLFKVATMLSKITAGASKDVLEGMTATQTGALFISNAFRFAETDVKAWLAELVDMSVEEFDKLPFDAPIEIVEALADQEDLASFFQRVKGLAGKITKS